jgi:hypothetical protein
MTLTEYKMEYFITMSIMIAILTFFTNCKSEESKGESIEKNKNFGMQLIENGFLDFSEASDYEKLNDGIIKSFNIYEESNNRIAHIDAEELAEFSFDFFLPQLQRILNKRNFKLKVQTAEDYEISNDIYINDEKIKLYTKEEMEKYSFWDTGARNFFNKINELLLQDGIIEKFYLLYDGNDLHVLLLTDKQYRIIKHRHFDSENEQPYLP